MRSHWGGPTFIRSHGTKHLPTPRRLCRQHRFQYRVTLKNGFGGAPDIVEETVKLSADVGLAGISIEDVVPVDAQPYPFDLSVERVRAANATASALSKDFVLVARADGFMYGSYDLDEAVRRIQAFEAAGADCVDVPYLKDIATVTTVCRSVSIPVNVGISTVENVKLAEFANAGAARLSLGMAMATASGRVNLSPTTGRIQVSESQPLEAHNRSSDSSSKRGRSARPTRLRRSRRRPRCHPYRENRRRSMSHDTLA
ncbi:isocitrate lyase/phosphoenolpyruvate mutase family protein [Jannaschia sp. S6380]|uniref:isocitrate lyase/phosphoenolpyruvate mutase family protein n=1 Tax=Jannaschia sp. S6380 TaxID=2926408 RepID=UPI00248AE6AB|nr:isocitrate lyase/phosphoenolpyruvate mutase family protein [Jannaschia sp. S6380]